MILLDLDLYLNGGMKVLMEQELGDLILMVLMEDGLLITTITLEVFLIVGKGII